MRISSRCVACEHAHTFNVRMRFLTIPIRTTWHGLPSGPPLCLSVRWRKFALGALLLLVTCLLSVSVALP